MKQSTLHSNDSAIEDLQQIARLAFDTAPMRCSDSHGCCDYHRLWPLARLTNPNGTRLAGREFLTAEIIKVAKTNPTPQVLISGGADTGILAIAIAALMNESCDPHFIFADRCETPVILNRALLLQHKLAGEAVVSDILSVDKTGIDIVLSHSFLIYFSRERLQRLFRKWASMLSTGGKLLISNLVANECGDLIGDNDSELMQNTIQNMRKQAAEIGFSEQDLRTVEGSCARIFRQSLSEHQLLTLQEMKTLLIEAGFECESISTYDRTQQSQRGPFSQNMIYTGARAEIVALKR